VKKKKQTRVLVVEDDSAHAEMIRRNIDRSGAMLMELATTLESCRRAIACNPPDIDQKFHDVRRYFRYLDQGTPPKTYLYD